jgi:uridylate kinase
VKSPNRSSVDAPCVTSKRGASSSSRCGTQGLPYVTTDTAAALRANELGAEVVLKATKVDGVFDRDPRKHDDASAFNHITYMDVINEAPERDGSHRHHHVHGK